MSIYLLLFLQDTGVFDNVNNELREEKVKKDDGGLKDRVKSNDEGTTAVDVGDETAQKDDVEACFFILCYGYYNLFVYFFNVFKCFD